MLTPSPIRLARDQFTSPTFGHHRSVRWGQVAALTPAVTLGLLAFLFGQPVQAASSGILAAMSILTGFTFAMSLAFWNKAIDARRDPRFAVDGGTLSLLDDMRNHLIFTVVVGCLVTGISLLQSVFTAPSPGPELTSATLVGLSVYMLTLVVARGHGNDQRREQRLSFASKLARERIDRQRMIQIDGEIR